MRHGGYCGRRRASVAKANTGAAAAAVAGMTPELKEVAGPCRGSRLQVAIPPSSICSANMPAKRGRAGGVLGGHLPQSGRSRTGSPDGQPGEAASQPPHDALRRRLPPLRGGPQPRLPRSAGADPFGTGGRAVSRNVHLHSRDVELLELLADRRVETLKVLHEKLWPGCARKSAYNRLGQLARAGYLEHLVRADPLPRPSVERRPSLHLYVLGPKAPAALRHPQPAQPQDHSASGLVHRPSARDQPRRRLARDPPPRRGRGLGGLGGPPSARRRLPSVSGPRRTRPDARRGRPRPLLESAHPRQGRGVQAAPARAGRGVRVPDRRAREPRGEVDPRAPRQRLHAALRCVHVRGTSARRALLTGHRTLPTPPEPLDWYEQILGDPGCT